MFLNYINNFRGIAIIIIVAYHCLPFEKVDNGEFTWSLINTLLVNCTILFVFISGFLFQHLIAKFKYVPYLKKRFSYMILPYIIISIPIIALYITKYWTEGPFVIKEDFYNKSVVEQIFLFYVTGSHLGQLWFIPMIVLFYLITPLFKFIDSNPKAYWLIPLFMVVSIYSGRPAGNDNAILSLVYFLPIYLFGMLVSKNKELIFKYADKFTFVLWVLFFLLSFFIHHAGYFYLTYFQKLVMSILLLHYLYKYDTIIGTRLDIVAKYSFGIYFIHYHILLPLYSITTKLDLFDLLYTNVFTFIVLIAVTVWLCMFVVHLSNMVFKSRSRYILGS